MLGGYWLRTALWTGQKQIYFITRIVVIKRCENTPLCDILQQLCMLKLR